MTVAELIKELEKLPKDLRVYYPGGAYKGDHRALMKIETHTQPTWGTPPGVYLGGTE